MRLTNIDRETRTLFIKLSPYLIALLIGLLIGVERERRSIEVKQAMGVRSFILVALTGALASGINQPLVTLGLILFAAAVTVIGYFGTTRLNIQDRKSVGLTTELAAMGTFGLGFLANHEPFLSLALGVIMLLILHNKTALHTFIRKNLKPEEIQAAAVLLLLAVGVVPLIPDRTIDPLHIFNPHRLALIVALIASIQFAGYAATRVFGQRIGQALSGFFAGIISSTVVFAMYPLDAKERPERYMAIASAAMFAMAATLFKLGILLVVVSWRVEVALLIPFLTLILLSTVIGTVLSLKDKSKATIKPVEPQNPLKLLSAIRLGTLITTLIFMFALIQKYFGDAYTKMFTFISALFELDGVVIASANLFENDAIQLKTAAITAMIAILASMFSKMAGTIFMGEGAYRKLVLFILIGFVLLTSTFLLMLMYVPWILLQVR